MTKLKIADAEVELDLSPEQVSDLLTGGTTANSHLFEHELDDEKHLRDKPGYWRMVEERMVTEQMLREGRDPKEPSFYFDVKRRVIENHKDDTLRRDRQRETKATQTISFTVEELEHLVQHFAMESGPVSRSIFDMAYASMLRAKRS